MVATTVWGILLRQIQWVLAESWVCWAVWLSWGGLDVLILLVVVVVCAVGVLRFDVTGGIWLGRTTVLVTTAVPIAAENVAVLPVTGALHTWDHTGGLRVVVIKGTTMLILLFFRPWVIGLFVIWQAETAQWL